MKALEKIFSITNTPDKKHKIVTILGLKIAININKNKTIKKTQKNYEKVLKRIRQKEKIKVLFLINEVSKWKTQSLYKLMKESKDFEPIIALTLLNKDKHLNKKEKKEIINANIKFFESKQIECISTYDIEKNRALPLKDFAADIIFYQQPWDILKKQKVEISARNALLCYVPYYLPDYCNLEYDCGLSFFGYLFRYYVLNKNLETIYKEYQQSNNTFNNNITAAGHTILDTILNNKTPKLSTKKTIIYAPHWSITHPKNQNKTNLSTFDWNGQAILDFAKAHPEIDWIYKPHPVLKSSLQKIGVMTNTEIDRYYQEWETFAKCCYTCDYIDLFWQSDAMITDSGSFLLEYFITGKPLIHLISKNNTNIPYPTLENISKSFYNVNNIEELNYILNEVIINNNDYLKNIREKILEEHSLAKYNNAQKILEDIRISIFQEGD